MEGALDLVKHLPIESAAPQAHYIEPDQRIAFRSQREGRDVTGDPRSAANHGPITNAAELVDDGAATQEGPITDQYVSSQQHGVGDDYMITDAAIMSHVTGRHQKAVGSYLGE